MITKYDKKPKIYYGNCRPVRVLKNNRVLGGWKRAGMSEASCEFSNTFNDTVALNGKAVNIPAESKSGEIIVADNIYEVEHSVECKLSRPNLAPLLEEKTEGGATLSHNSDGTFNITLQDDFSEIFMEYKEIITLPAGTYSFEVAGANIAMWNSGFNNGDPFWSGSFTLEEATTFDIYIFSVGENVSLSIKEDLSSVKVSRYGKNLLDYRAATDRQGNPLTIIEDGILWDKMINYYFYIPCFIPAGTTIAISCKSDFEENTDSISNFQIEYEDGTLFYGSLNLPYTLTANMVNLRVRKKNADITESSPIKITNLQLEIGQTVTEYEPYMCQTVTANADGIVEGITSLTPRMTIMTDKEGAVINAHYLKSLNSESLPPAPDNIRQVIGAKGKITVTDKNENSTETKCPELYGLEVGEAAPYNYTETVDGVQKYYITDTLEGGEITRRIGVYVFDGTEPFESAFTEGQNTKGIKIFSLLDAAATNVLCSHFANLKYPLQDEVGLCLSSDKSTLLINMPEEYDTLEKIQSFFTDQYSKGTPVTLYYALAQPVKESVENYPKSLPFYTYIDTEAESGYIPYGMQDCVKVCD